MKEELFRKIPSVDSLIQDKEIKLLFDKFGRAAVLDAVREELAKLRSRIQGGKEIPKEKEFVAKDVAARVLHSLDLRASPSLRRAINGTGIIIHTGLGRSVLAGAAREALVDAIRGYSNLAVDAETGKRGDRDTHLDSLLCQLTGAEAATVVNNNAAATVLILNTLAKGKEVIVSRGQLVEIGGSFRMPEVMATSGAILHEVGTTNKTHLKDYTEAVNENTGAILHVHHSNYRIMGFAEEPRIEELTELGRKHNIAVIDDLGSGALIDLRKFGLETEPLVQDSIKAGADVACFSGDKLIGGPQSGIIVGKRDVVNRIKKNPLKRAFRVGKLTIAALEATLKLFLNPEKLTEVHPTYRMLSLSLDVLKRRAQRLARNIKNKVGASAEIWVEDGSSQVGSGSVPVETIPTKLLAVKARRFSADELARELRKNSPPVFSRVQNDTVLLDTRTVLPDEDCWVEKALIDTLT